MITFLFPALMLPVALLAFLYWRRSAERSLWRTLALLILVLLAGYPMVDRATKSLRLVVVADRSRSMPTEARDRSDELIGLITDELAAGDDLAIISFASEPHLEAIVEPGGTFAEFQNPYHPDASALSEALRLGLEVAGNRPNSRLLLLSDGEYTGMDPRFAATLAAERKVPIDVRHLGSRSFFDLAVVDAEAPPKVLEREPFTLHFTVSATLPSRGQWRVLRNGVPLKLANTDGDGWRNAEFVVGRNDITVADFVPQGGTFRYSLEVRAEEAETESVQENNVAEHYVRVLGEDRVLVVTEDGQPNNLANALNSAGIPVSVTSIRSYGFELIYLQGYKSVVLSGVPINTLTTAQTNALARFVTEEGGGLVVTGGRRSYQGGGYYKSPLDPLLPVSLDVEQRQRTVATAIVYVLDRSGSMGAPVGGGITKMDLANRGVIESMRLLGPLDQIGVIAVDSAPKLIQPLTTLENRAQIENTVRSIESMGGGIFVYTGLRAAGALIANASPLNKHIVLFSDAMDSEEPGQYRRLIADFRDAGITVSVIGLGTEQDVDAEFLRDIARRGEGEIFFSSDPRVLPQLFAMNTMNMTRQSFITDANVPWTVRPVSRMMSAGNQWEHFEATDYNLLFSRPEANVALQSQDEDVAPGIAFWQRGAGRVVAVAFDVDGSFARVPFAGEALLDSVRWSMGSQVSEDFALSVRREGTIARVALELSEEERRDYEGATLSVFSPDGSTEQRPLRWAGRNELEIDVPLEQIGAYRGLVKLGDRTIRLDPVSLPSSPEFRHDLAEGEGRRTLEELAALSGGRELLDVRRLFEEREVGYARRPFTLPLVLALLVLIVLEVAEERWRLEARLRIAAGKTREALASFGARMAGAGRRTGDLVMRAGGDAIDTSEDDASTPSATVASSTKSDATRESGGLGGAAAIGPRRRFKAKKKSATEAPERAANPDAAKDAPTRSSTTKAKPGEASGDRGGEEGLGYLRDLKKRGRR